MAICGRAGCRGKWQPLESGLSKITKDSARIMKDCQPRVSSSGREQPLVVSGIRYTRAHGTPALKIHMIGSESAMAEVCCRNLVCCLVLVRRCCTFPYKRLSLFPSNMILCP